MRREVLDFFMENQHEIVTYSDILDSIDEIKRNLDVLQDYDIMGSAINLERVVREKIGKLVQELFEEEDEDESRYE